MQKGRSVALVLALLILGICMVFALSGGDGKEIVDGKNIDTGSIDGSDSTTEEQQEDDLRQYVVELKRPLSQEENSALQAGVQVGGETGSNSILIRAGEKQVHDLRDLPFVKSVYEYRPEQKLSRELKEEGGENEKIRVTITLFAAEDGPAVTRLVESYGGSVLEENGRYLRVQLNNAGVSEKLAASPAVMYIEEDAPAEFLNDRARDITGARPLAVPRLVTDAGLTGAGQTIGLADSGLDTGSMGNLHPDLENGSGRKPRVIMLKSWAGVETPADTVGHGTHMAGTLVGSGEASGGRYAGMAPGASLYFQGIVDEEDNLALPLNLWELFEPAYEADVRIHVNGWGRKQNTYSSSAAQVDDFIFNHPDFLAIFGAGNFGPLVGSLTSEANSKNALTVGASESPRPAFENSIGDTGAVAGFSSRGPTPDGRIKPELVAPGTNIISAASRVVEDYLPGRPEYTVMRGTSMAAAVAGGATAILRQYLQENAAVQEPSAALLKAVLINGARKLEGVTGATGYGLLDIGGTVLALENDLFELVDNREGVSTGDYLAFEREVTHSGAPFKATLAWTDPAAVPGSPSALVNDLDLKVIAPDGTIYYGNDFNQKGVRDTRNNVEQVYITDPRPGTYKIIVAGNSVSRDTTAGGGITQDFALVYGQPPARDIVAGESGEKEVMLAGGNRLSLPGDTSVVVNDTLLPGGNIPACGAEIYLVGPPDNPQRVYAVVRSGLVNGVKTLEMDGVTVLVRMEQERRDGGYAIDRRAEDVLTLNGHAIDEGQIIPPGASVTGNVNPFSQTIWKADITSREVSGVIAGVDLENRQIELLNDDQIYMLAEEASLSFTDVDAGGDIADNPFGAATAAHLEELLPGMPVQVTLGSDGRVYHLSVKRHMVTGRVSNIDVHSGNITLSSGGIYHVMPGIKILKDLKPVQLTDVGPGDLVMLNLVPDSTNVLGLSAYSAVCYGRVIYTENDVMYLMDNVEGFHMLRYHPEIQVFRWGMSSGTSVLSPGQWVRVIKDPVEGDVLRVDVAEPAGRTEETMGVYVAARGIIKTLEGNEYRLSSVSVLTKNELPVGPGDLVPGEPLIINALYGSGGEKVVASLEAKTRPGVQPPELKVKSTIPFADFSMVTGTTTGTRLDVWYSDGSHEEVELAGSGEFYFPVQPDRAGDVRLVAVDTATGGVAGIKLSLPRRQKSFTDIAGHWAEIDIRQLVDRGMLKGYPDGTFRPDKPVSRVEFTAMLTRLMGGSSSGSDFQDLPYRDGEKIPDWARSSVALAVGRGLVSGYEDNTFRPDAGITREEAASLLVRAYGILKGIPESEGEALPYADGNAIAPWAREDTALARELGLLGGRADNRFVPKDNLTRAETTAALNRLLAALTATGWEN